MIDGLIITDLHKFSNENGSVYHGMRKTDPGYNGFEEIYFSYIKPGSLKAWKMHKIMTLNLVVPWEMFDSILLRWIIKET